MITVISSSFSRGGAIPSKYTCDGMDISPHLSWSFIPSGTKSIVVICTDPDAPGGTFIHWAAYNIPPHVTTLPEGVMGLTQAGNDFGGTGYGGPCPLSGIHRYYFTVYALNTIFGRGKEARALLSSMKGYILDKGEIMGTYSRTRKMRAKIKRVKPKISMLGRAVRMVRG